MRKCKICNQDVYVTPKGKETALCATHALEALMQLLYPRKSKSKPSHPRLSEEELRHGSDKN
jgi:hypothetical protein